MTANLLIHATRYQKLSLTNTTKPVLLTKSGLLQKLHEQQDKNPDSYWNVWKLCNMCTGIAQVVDSGLKHQIDRKQMIGYFYAFSDLRTLSAGSNITWYLHRSWLHVQLHCIEKLRRISYASCHSRCCGREKELTYCGERRPKHQKDGKGFDAENPLHICWSANHKYVTCEFYCRLYEKYCM